MISDEDIRRVREATDLVALVGERVPLKQRNREFWGCCPFHNEKSPSFKVDPASQLYHCFGCGEGGDAFKYIMKTENSEFPDAVRYLAERANIALVEDKGSMHKGKRTRLLDVCKATAEFYHLQLMRVNSPGSDGARAYLAGRGFGGAVPNDWTLGYAPGRGALVEHLRKLGFTKDEITEADVGRANEHGRLRDRFYERVIFPINDIQGRPIAFGGRIMGAGEPKYLNSSETPLFHKRENLYAIDKAKASITSTGKAIIVEGYTDVIAMHRMGFTNTVATLGTALTSQHIKLLARFAREVIYLFDGDEAGMRAADRAAELIDRIATPEGTQGKVDLKVAVLPAGADPADYGASAGAAGMQAVLDAARPLIEFAIERRLGHWDLKVPEQKDRALNDAVRLIVPVRGSLLAEDYVNYLADRFLVDGDVVKTALAKAKPLGVTAVEEEAPRSRPQTVIPADKGAAYERELLILYVQERAARPTLAKAFARIDWGNGTHAHIAEALQGLKGDESPAQATAAVLEKVPQADEVLGASRLQTDITDVRHMARILMYSLKEEQLNARIREVKARLRHLPPGGEYDEAFAEATRLQNELADVRKDKPGAFAIEV
jgi:DNA primase